MLKWNPNAVLIMSGGQGSGEDIPESNGVSCVQSIDSGKAARNKMCGFWDKDNLNDWVNEEKIVPIIQMITARTGLLLSESKLFKKEVNRNGLTKS